MAQAAGPKRPVADQSSSSKTLMSQQYIRLQPDDTLPALNDFSPFRALVVVEEDVSPDWQSAVSNWLARSGCLYMMAWGKRCGSWNDSVDTANLEQFNYGDIPEDKFIMTTWHENESLEETIWFAKHTAFHPPVELPNVLFLHIGTTDREAEFLSLYEKA